MKTLIATFEPSIKKRIEGLDEIRGIATILVFIGHGNLIFSNKPDQFLNILGPVGVDMFFIVSGYLISHILIKSTKDKLYFKKFYIRRLFRIWPLYIIVIGIGITIGYFGGNYKNTNAVIPYYITFTQNYITPYELGTSLPGMGHLWSLAIEEQFYLLLPILFYYVDEKKLILAVLSICLMSLIGRLIFFESEHVPLNYYYTNFKQTYFRLHILGIGVILALQKPLTNLTIFAIIWLILLINLFNNNGLLELPITYAMGFIIWYTIYKKPIINSKLLAHIGKLCFGLYIIHFPIVRFLGTYSYDKPKLIQLITYTIYLLATYLIARVSFKYFEIPMQNLRSRYEK